MDLKLHDVVELKKEHPCGSRRWEVLRVGMDIRLRCAGCGHEVLAPRRKVEKSIKRVIPKEEIQWIIANGPSMWPWAWPC